MSVRFRIKRSNEKSYDQPPPCKKAQLIKSMEIPYTIGYLSGKRKKNIYVIDIKDLTELLDLEKAMGHSLIISRMIFKNLDPGYISDRERIACQELGLTHEIEIYDGYIE